MAPPIPSAELRLSYPLYALDFDNDHPNRLVVGGGGGAARSGVGNKISVLDTSHEGSLQIVSEIELSRDEDSVNTLAVGTRRNKSVLVYAGINSAEIEIKKGNNEHFRAFAAELPSGAKSDPKIAEVSRSSLFSTTDAEAYQRLLRISGDVGAAATGTIGRSKDPQIAIFGIPPPTSDSTIPKLRGKVELTREAMDMDVLQISEDEHQLVYCDDRTLYTMIIGKSTTSGPHTVYTLTEDEAIGLWERPSFRCVRFLTPTFVLVVANVAKAGGAVLQGFRLPKRPDLGKEEKEGKAKLAISAKLPKTVKRATGLAVRNLHPPASPSSKQDNTQFVIAATGQDSSISIYTLDHQSIGDINLIANLLPVTTLKEVHLGPISGLAFSPFPSPPSQTGQQEKEQPLHLHLASIGSMANTCIVHTLPLKQLPPSSPQTSTKQRPRHVLGLKSHRPSPTNILIGFSIVFVLLAMLLQGILEIRGASRPIVYARSYTPATWHSPEWYNGQLNKQQHSPSDFPDILDAPEVTFEDSNRDLFAEYHDLAKTTQQQDGGEDTENGKKRVVLHHVADDEVVRVEGHDEERHGEAKGWEELEEGQKEAWKEKLRKAGQWGEHMGEAVFKGVLFGELAGVVGAMVA
ncbi:hypothetical protein B0J18DRAFT_429590 [Chaetomium sp. MPI-SDFR-AT-0129]|nr:hypothetical protein B0J18DRAFT_429590 [Chaetomium sp. MPI-SDFR-AT-0129]